MFKFEYLCICHIFSFAILGPPIKEGKGYVAPEEKRHAFEVNRTT